MLSFRLNWKIALFTFALLPLLLLLGFWQLDREQEKRELQAVFDRRLQDEPVALVELDPDDSNELAYRKVVLRGQFDNARYFLLDNRIHASRVGFEVIMPFSMNSGAAAQTVLINRGWLPAGANREELPVPAPVNGEQQVTATVYVPTAPAFMLGHEDDEAENSWPRLVQTAEVAWMAAQLQEETVFPYTLRLAEGSAGLLQPNWPLLNMMPEKHRAYAVQWFAMAAVLLLLFITSCFGTERKTNDAS
ncbi:MAG: SURF1 family protein [Pseudomonadales bacterium]|nr:SURF1 family protein [Pseudomonadales bacterium]